jgi:hypothetical protein
MQATGYAGGHDLIFVKDIDFAQSTKPGMAKELIRQDEMEEMDSAVSGLVINHGV